MALPTLTNFENAYTDVTTIAQVTLNNYTGSTTTNRDGETIGTLKQRLDLLVYDAPVAYAGSIAFTTANHRKTLIYDDITYAVIPTQLPFTTTGTWNTDKGKLFPIQFDVSSLNEDILDLVNLSGRPINSVNLGTFNGDILTDNLDIKDTIQGLGDELALNRDVNWRLLDSFTPTSVEQINIDVTSYTGFTKYKIVLEQIRPYSRVTSAQLLCTINGVTTTDHYRTVYVMGGASQTGITTYNYTRIDLTRSPMLQTDMLESTIELQGIVSLVPTSFEYKTTHTSDGTAYKYYRNGRGSVGDTVVLSNINLYWQSSQRFNPTGLIKVYGSKE